MGWLPIRHQPRPAANRTAHRRAGPIEGGGVSISRPATLPAEARLCSSNATSAGSRYRCRSPAACARRASNSVLFEPGHGRPPSRRRAAGRDASRTRRMPWSQSSRRENVLPRPASRSRRRESACGAHSRAGARVLERARRRRRATRSRSLRWRRPKYRARVVRPVRRRVAAWKSATAEPVHADIAPCLRRYRRPSARLAHRIERGARPAPRPHSCSTDTGGASRAGTDPSTWSSSRSTAPSSASRTAAPRARFPPPRPDPGRDRRRDPRHPPSGPDPMPKATSSTASTSLVRTTQALRRRGAGGVPVGVSDPGDIENVGEPTHSAGFPSFGGLTVPLLGLFGVSLLGKQVTQAGHGRRFAVGC